jgi:hypothetical protein
MDRIGCLITVASAYICHIPAQLPKLGVSQQSLSNTSTAIAAESRELHLTSGKFLELAGIVFLDMTVPPCEIETMSS